MTKRWNRAETWLTVGVAGVGAVLLAVAGLWMYVSATATPIHPNPQDAPSATQLAPAARWTDTVERARQVVRAGLSEHNLPGLSVAVGVGRDIVWAEGFGWANLESKTAVTPSHRFRLGTASAALTSAAVGRLLEQGRLKLDDEIQTSVPEFPRKPWPITLRQMLAHLSGMRSDGGDEGPLFGTHCERPVDALSAFADRELLFEPGTQFRFSNFGWIVASAAIERASGKPFLAYMRDEIFDPLEMRDTRADSTTKEILDVATTYFPRFAADPRYGPDLMREIDLSCYAGAGVFLSTPSDLVRFGLAMNRGTLLQPATVQLLQTSQKLRSEADTGYGLGWSLQTISLGGQQASIAGHNGNVLGGMVASLQMQRDRGIVVAVMSNTSYADTASLASNVIQVFAENVKPSSDK